MRQGVSRFGREGVAAVAKDFWRREIKDRRRLPWGKQTPKPFIRHRSPYQSFYRAVRWWEGAKRHNILPEPFARMARLGGGQ